jgi:hypothetical protein
MKVIIAGGRDFCNKVTLYNAVQQWCKEVAPITEVVCGMAEGADTLGMLWANFMEIPVIKFPADWGKHGKSAGPIRNKQMAECADGLIAFWDGESKGTKNMIDLATKKGLIVAVINYKSKNKVQ